MEQFISHFGVPRSLHSDQGLEFESDLIAELCKLLHINKTRTVPYKQKSDGGKGQPDSHTDANNSS